MKNEIGLVLLRMRIGRTWWLSVLFLLGTTATVKAGDFTCTTNPNNTITITGYTGSGGAVVIPSTIEDKTVTGIGERAFAYCRSLSGVTIPNGVTSIGGWAFAYCTSLSGVTIPNSITGLGEYAFYSCTSLSGVTIPSSVTSIGNGAFSGCASLSAITVDALNSFYSSLDGVLFNKSQSTLIQCPRGKTGSYTIPDSVTSIGNGAFNLCDNLTSVTIPNSVTSIRNGALAYCISLTSVTIPNSVTNIGDNAFEICTSLTSVTIGNGVISIGNLAFSGCAGLTSVTIPNSVTSIGEYAFYYCISLASVTIGNGVISIGDGAFAYCTSLTGIYFLGNAPSLGSNDVFYGANNATVYYLPGTTGWGTTFGGLPTVLWDPPLGPTIKANGAMGTVPVNYPATVSVTVEMNADNYEGVAVDWWVIAFAHSGEWYYLNSDMQWPSFSGDLAFCQPVFQGPLFNLSSTSVLNSFQLPRGPYDFWFAIDYPMDGILDPNGQILFDKVTVVVQ